MPLLKLKNASYPEPDALALVNEYDLGRDGSKWRHGWVPLNAQAAAIKAKKPVSGGSWKEHTNESVQRGNAYSRSSVNDADRSAGAHYAKTGVTHIQSRSGSTHEIHHVSDGLVHTKDGRVMRAGSTTSQPRGATERIQDRIGGKSRLSTSTVRPSRAKVAGEPKREGKGLSGARLTIRPGEYRGESGHHISGTDTQGRKVKVFSPGPKENAFKASTNIQHGKPAFAIEAKSVISDGKNMSAADHTRMAIHHNEEAKKALDAGDRTKANAHVEAMRAHNSAALQAASADDIVKLREAAQPGPQKDAVNAEIRRRVTDPKTTNSTGLRTLGGYGTNDLKAIANQKGAYASSPSSADTIAKAEAELKSRGYVKSPTGVWAKPKAPQRKQSVPALKGRATPVKRGTKSIAGVRFKPGQ